MVPNGRYDPVKGAVTFIAARDITSGTSKGIFSPTLNITRGQFITMLLKTYGIEADENPEDSFSDAGNTYYTGYLSAAKRMSISTGVGNNMFAPDKELSRQEMLTMLYNALKSMGQMVKGNSGKATSDFTDSSNVSPWAKQAIDHMVGTGIVAGTDGRLDPEGVTKRAQMAQVLYNLIGK